MIWTGPIPVRAMTVALAALIPASLAGCRQTPPPARPATEIFSDDLLGLSFELPADWRHDRDGRRHIFSGPEGTPLFFTTVTLQPLDERGKLDDALSRAYEPVLGFPAFAWENREPVTVSGRPGLRYGVTFELHEKQRRKSGLVIDTSRQLLDLSYGATTELFPLGIPAFETIVGTLTFY